MRWKQFLMEVTSMNEEQARQLIKETPPEKLIILDVRQPSEYASGHIPGAKLIPLPVLSDQFQKINKNKTILVYCASGARSRAAAQMLSGKAFSHIINLAGGFNSWDSEAAYFSEERGLELFTGEESVEETLVAAYSLEQGLFSFYQSMEKKVEDESARHLFHKLSQIEVKHKDHILTVYGHLTGKKASRQLFDSTLVPDIIEGGLTIKEYGNLFMPSWDSPKDIIELALSIEAQAYDLYIRAADSSTSKTGKKALMQIATEEKHHMASLGKLMDKIMGKNRER